MMMMMMTMMTMIGLCPVHKLFGLHGHRASAQEIRRMPATSLPTRCRAWLVAFPWPFHRYLRQACLKWRRP
eukprot:1074986-Karenia_brevis.AAC.1